MKTQLSKEAQRDLELIRKELKKQDPNPELLSLYLNGPKYNISISSTN